MKFSKIACILLVFWIIGLMMEGCCPDPMYFTCSVSSITLSSDTINPVSRNHYRMGIHFEVEKSYIAESRTSVSLIRSTRAMEQCRDMYVAEDTVTSIRFFTNQAFDASHPSGTDISDHFMAMKINEDWPSGTITYVTVPLANALKGWCRLNMDGFIASLNCVLVTPPDAGTYTFRVVVGLSDGRELEQSIKAILE